jgi:hypothetical protein
MQIELQVKNQSPNTFNSFPFATACVRLCTPSLA